MGTCREEGGGRGGGRLIRLLCGEEGRGDLLPYRDPKGGKAEERLLRKQILQLGGGRILPYTNATKRRKEGRALPYTDPRERRGGENTPI